MAHVARELTNIEKTHRLKFALMGDACNAAYLNMATAGSVLLLFMDKIGLDKAQIGVLLALLGFGPMIAPVTSQVGARFGFKRLWSFFTVIRVIFLAGMIAAPWVASRYGVGAAFVYVAGVLAAFGLARSTADSMGGPWSAEFVPAGIRGKYTAMQTIVGTMCGAATIFTVGSFLGAEAPVGRFLMFFSLAVVLGLLPVLFYSRVAGGAPQPDARLTLGNMLTPLSDPVYRRHLMGHMLVNFGWFVTMPFVPLYLKDHIGLPANQIVMLDAITMTGSLLSSFMWGWAADRYGGKPVMVTLLATYVLLPVGLILMPRHSSWSAAYAMTMYFLLGFVGVGWNIGFVRYFYTNLVPRANRTPYIALNACMAGLMIGSGPLLAGWALEKLSWLSGSFGPITIDQHTPFFLVMMVAISLATWMMAGLPAHGAVGVRQFAGLFFQGNPLATATGLMAFRYAGVESKRVAVVERLGATRSPLSVEELIEAMEDPSFSVQYEAIVSTARTVRDSRLAEALIKLLRGGADPGLQMAAVWALGRINDPAALPVLRALLDSPYRSMRAQVARALGMLGDGPSADRLMAMFRDETDLSLRVAYGAAVSSLARQDALPGLLQLLRELPDAPEDQQRRKEASLAVATLVGRDDAALLLWRRMHEDEADTLGGTMLAIRQRLANAVPTGEWQAMNQRVERCAYAFAAGDFEPGVGELREILTCVRAEAFTAEAWAVLAEAQSALGDFGPSRREYVMLAVHSLHVGLRPE